MKQIIFRLLFDYVLMLPSIFVFGKTNKSIYKYNIKHIKCMFQSRDSLYDEFERILSKADEFTKREKAKIRRDFKFFYYLIGIEPEEYFINCFFEEKFKTKLNNISRRRHGMFQTAVNKKEHRQVVDDKTEFNKLFADFLYRDWMQTKGATKEKTEEFLNKNETVFLKPLLGSSGKGIEKIKWSQVENKEELINDIISKDYILEANIKQSGFLNKINPSTVNTLRMNTLTYPDGQVVFLNAFLRTGIEGAVVDNVHSGGIIWHIDSATGEIKYGSRGYGKMIYEHPSSKINLKDVQIPRFKEAVELVKSAALMAPQMPQIGWDVVISDDFIAIIEGNSGAAFWNTCSKGNIYKIMKKYLRDNKVLV